MSKVDIEVTDLSLATFKQASSRCKIIFKEAVFSQRKKPKVDPTLMDGFDLLFEECYRYIISTKIDHTSMDDFDWSNATMRSKFP